MGGSNSALEPAGLEAGLQPISLTALFPTELSLPGGAVPRGVAPLFKSPFSGLYKSLSGV